MNEARKTREEKWKTERDSHNDECAYLLFGPKQRRTHEQMRLTSLFFAAFLTLLLLKNCVKRRSEGLWTAQSLV